MTKIFLGFCLLCAFIALPLQAQQSYSSTGSELAKQIDEQFAKTTVREEIAAAVKRFTTNCASGRIPEAQVQLIAVQFNGMAAKKMRSVPHFADYIQAIDGMMQKSVFDKKFVQWQTIVTDITNKSDKSRLVDFERFLEFSNTFFNENILNKSLGGKWQALATDYRLDYTDNKPALSFDQARLYCYAAKDTISIFNAKGTYFPFEQKWTGQAGRVTWDRVGLDPNNIYADLPPYTIDMTKGDYTIEEATFFHKKLFNKPLKGRVIDKLSARVEGEFIYPQFESYELNLVLKNIAPNTEFSSGFAMRGPAETSYGTATSPAKLRFIDPVSKKVQIMVSGKAFRVQKEREIVAINVAAALYFGEDSIYHPRLEMHYQIATREIRLVRDSKALSRIPFMSSYHKLESNVDGIFWDMNKPSVDFKMVSELKNARVVMESFDLYDNDRMYSYQMYTQHDPIGKLAAYIRNGQYEVPGPEFAAYLGNFKTTNDILNLITRLTEDGFAYYIPETDMIRIRDKALHYEESRKKTVDFDRIALVSESSEQNAQLDMTTREMLVTGVKSIGLSDSQNVIIYPKKGYVRAKNNRDMDVDGTIVAGSVDFGGKNFAFKYDPFHIKMDTVAQIQVYVDTRHKRFEKITPVDGVLAPITTLIRDARGILYVDKEDNKCGRISHPSYPRFESTGNAYLYYNSKNLYNGAYKKDTFYFKLNPFTFEDLDEIQPENMVFPGTMVSGNIFPAFEQTTTLQDDLSLGFIKNTPAQGMPTYKKGSFSGTISMSGKGLIGEGKIEYLASSLVAKEMIFLPDSMLTTADTFYTERKIVKGIEFPSSHNSNVKVKWLADRDSMMVYMTKRPFLMYEDKVSLKGHLIMTDKGLRGRGVMNWDEASIRANDFVYTSSTFKSDSSDVAIKNREAAKVAFDSYNVKSRVDMDKYLGEFLANGPSIPINLPFNQFKTNASEFYWLMNDRLVNIRMPDDENLAYFVSTHPDQGGLKFKASGGVVNLAENSVKVDGVPYITIADAKIRPPDTQVFIEANAKIKTMENALLVADSTNEYHKITNATINIQDINHFTGKGEYKYRGKNMKKQEIMFDLIGTKEDEENKGKFFTTAQTILPEEKGFKLNSSIKFKGDVVLDSRKKFLVFDGFAKLELMTKAIDIQWFRFTDQIDPENIQIDVSTPIGEYKDTLSFGILQDMDNLQLYATFLTKKRTPLDTYVFRATGELASESETNTYRVGSADKLDGKTEQGNVYTLQDAQGIVKGNGKILMGEDWNMVQVASAGQIEINTQTNATTIRDVVLGIDFDFMPSGLEAIGEIFRAFNSEAKEINYGKEGFYKSAVELVEKGYVGDFKGMMNRQGYLEKKVKGLDQAMIFANLNMVWDSSLSTFRSEGPFGIAFLGEKYVNRMVKGFIEFGARQTGDFFNIYLETDKNAEGRKQWFFFAYKKGVMQVVSSELLYNQLIVNQPEKKRLKIDKKTGQTYQYSICPLQKRHQFVAMMGGDVSDIGADPYAPTPPNPNGQPASPDGQPTNPDGQPANPDGQPTTPDGGGTSPKKEGDGGGGEK